MGYCTHYTLDIDSTDPLRLALIQSALMKDGGATFALMIDGPARQHYPSREADSQWLADATMRHLADRFPGVLFTLSGEGEEAGDLWRIYARDGRSYKAPAVVMHPPFDEAKLQ